MRISIIILLCLCYLSCNKHYEPEDTPVYQDDFIPKHYYMDSLVLDSVLK